MAKKNFSTRDTRPTPPPPGQPTQIGAYRILEKLGEGGMGVVYLAEQDSPVRRRVALKVIKLGMDTHEVVARFEAERQALAMMKHGNIATVFDGGVTEQGRPFFAMEHVPGVPITEYCDRQRLTTTQRLQLFIPVCEAIQHAHQKGVIHRDVKPSNILVALSDGRPVPKVIDFGVAKAINQRLTEKTIFTQQGRMIGTPAYMSPEQAEMSGLSVDTTTDVYSLGAVLYELLAGLPPFDPKELMQLGLEAVHRVIREREPSRPSTRITTLQGPVAEEVARCRKTRTLALVRQLRGDPDWIIMRAMEKDPARRYLSASEFAADIRRHLNHEPVLAHRPSSIYRVKKFVRRHTTAVVFAGTVLLLLVAFGVVMSVLLSRALRAERVAAEEATTATETADFLVGLFEVSSPRTARGETVTARQVLDRGADRIRSELSGQPAVQGRMMSTVGDVYRSLGLFEESESLLEEALRLRQSIGGDQSLDVAQSLTRLGRLAVARRDYVAAETHHRRALAIRRTLLGDEHALVAESIDRLANSLREQGKLDQAGPLYQQALAMRTRLYGEEHVDVAHSINALAVLRHNQRDYAAAEPLYRESLAMRRQLLGPVHPDIAASLDNLGNLLWATGDLDGAEAPYREALAMRRRLLGDEHPDLAYTLINVAIFLSTRAEYDEAEALYQEALGINRRTFGDRHVEVARNLYNLACLAAVRGDLPGSLQYLQSALDAGFSDAWIEQDTDLAVHAGSEEFEQILAEVRRRNEE